ncbi:MAG: lipopolysaccharide biosynthesis protein RfbH [Vicinamibacteria bacterium]
MKPPDPASAEAERLRAEILALTERYHAAAFPARPFEKGRSTVPVAGRVFDARELQALVEAALDGWFTTGRFADELERRLAELVGVRDAILVNSGSSANLLAVTALTSPLLGDERLRPGDEVITVAAGFPTTVAPIVQNGLVPVFVDVSLPTYNVDAGALDAALSPRTRAIVLAHTLGNPFDLGAVADFAERHDLWLVEDCCDALGSTYRGKTVGSFGDLATLSFYPAHHVTTGEGGAVLTSAPRLRRIVESLRDWGRDCWCAPGHDGTCGKRFGWTLGGLPAGYDHKYIYSHLGYNLKATDMQAALGVAQIAKLPTFGEKRRANFRRLRAAVADLAPVLVLPEATPRSDPSWFGFPLSVREHAGFSRRDLVVALEAGGVATRQLFAGNLVRQPAFEGAAHRVPRPLVTSDFVMNRTFWIGVYPGLSDAAIDHAAETLHAVVSALGRTAR